MLALSGAEWEELRHAYGPASDIPPLLRDLAELPPCDSAETEPYFTLWSSLCHQGDVYSASYAALPHLAMVCGKNPGQAHWSILQLAIAIELSRLDGYGPAVPDSLAGAYDAAIKELPGIAVDMLRAQGAKLPTNIAAAALAVGNKQPRLAEAFFELDVDTAEPFLEWFRDQ